MSDINKLRSILARIDRRGYKAYQDIRGIYRTGDVELAIDHVQGDPFAAPSRVRVIMPTEVLRLPDYATQTRRIALEDYLARRAHAALRRHGTQRRGSGKSGQVYVDVGGQEVVERTACRLEHHRVELRLSVGLPAAGRSILGRAAEDLLVEDLPQVAREALTLEDFAEAERFIATVEDAEAIRAALEERRLIAFVGEGAILPRKSGVNQEPLQGQVIPFATPPELAVEIDTPHSGRLTGMGIPEGVTLIVGGGFHGKSTLLDALARGVYPHIPGDGRERVVTRADAVKIRAEDGRRVVGVDLGAFIGTLPLGRTTDSFTSDNASGSTSQAANILEALEVGSQLLLMDEDTCATNFMIRDQTMRELVPSDAEPIIPLIDRIRQLHREIGVSSILVIGGAGDYFSVADTIIWMHDYRPEVVTDRAQAIAKHHDGAHTNPPGPWPGVVPRAAIPSSVDPTRRDRTRVRARGTEEVGFGSEAIDLRQVEQLVDPSQTRLIGDALVYALKRNILDGKHTMDEVMDLVEQAIDQGRLDAISPHKGHPGDYARPRRFELAAALNRLRSLQVRQMRP